MILNPFIRTLVSDPFSKKGNDQFTMILCKPVMINNVEDIVVCVDQKVFNFDHFLHCFKCINSATPEKPCSYNNLFSKRKDGYHAFLIKHSFYR